ncbi:uncharacterized protein LOC113498972 isoform X2 [Trichoplusia ni]|uniref:Uncharacterized protein LOC113498972 isoform X2 n=1 Tax=Trichoplusia ni TaxID=7111 RepID=A0A7E5W375_TRINI|nr:uncharacterized protein LOC113498972 isoform X2 [Trichoplusia ni]
MSDAASVMTDEMKKFSNVAKQFAENQKSNLDTASHKIQEEVPKIGHAVMKGVEAFLDALKAKIVDGSKELEEKARSLFRGAEDENDISLEKFKEVIEKFAVEQKRNFEEVAQQLEKEGPTVVKAVIAGVSAFKDVMKGK